MKNTIRVGTRGSVLAMRQTEIVVERLKSVFADTAFEVRKIKTTGDKILDAPLSKIGGKGLFTKELESALLERSIDMAVHSLKDLPTEIPEGLCVGAVLERDNPLDVLVSVDGLSLDDLPGGAVVGTSSLRRKAQLANFRGDLEFRDLRGNLDTRIRKLKEGLYDAIVVSAAGLDRLNIDSVGRFPIPPEISLPAVGQGAIAVECREADEDIEPFLDALEHGDTRFAADAERALLRELEGGCQVPIGALARVEGGRLMLDACIASLDGGRLFRDFASGPNAEAGNIGKGLAMRLLDIGGAEVMEEIRNMEKS
ncbi:MAG: hydroxymethylbilane synthase [bacterium]